MEALAQERLTNNAYRILGLGGDARQETIQQAARRMRLLSTATKIPPTSWDLPWLGPINRTKPAIEQAVARLNDPAWRVQERMLWFCGSPDDVSAMQKAPAASLENPPPPARQNKLISDLAGALFQPLPIDPKIWAATLEGFTRLSNSPDHARWQLELETTGGFEKPATESEITQFQQTLAQNLAASLDHLVEKALDDEDVPAAAAFLEILRGAGTKSHRRVLDRLEAMLEQRCHIAQSDLRAGIRLDPQARETNDATCQSVRKYFDESIAPLRRDLMKLAGDEYERIRRIRWQCARLLSMLGEGWIYAYQFIVAEQTLNDAMGNAQGETQEKEIRGQLNENQRRAAQQRVVYQKMPVVREVAEGVYAIAPAQAGPSVLHYQRPRPTAPLMPTNNRKTAGWVLAIIIVFCRVVALILSPSYSSSKASSPPPRQSYTPSYSPQPSRPQPSRPPSYNRPSPQNPRTPQPYRPGRR